VARPKKRSSLQTPETLDGILDRSGENRFARVRMPFARDTWVRVVGPRIADRTRPLKLEGGELLVLVATSVWSSELTMLSGDVLRRLQLYGIEAQRLRFRVGQIDVDRPPERRLRRVVPSAVPLPPALERSVRGIEDHDLMDEIRRAAEANLAWQTKAEKGPSREATEPVAPSLPTAARETDPPGRGSRNAPESAPRSRADGPRRPR
jgi:hypothetical protein